MADKLRDLFPVEVSFGKGEQPSSDKFLGWANQTSAGLGLVEKALGDVWGEKTQHAANAGSFLLSRLEKRAHQIANLAALIGPASFLNPHRISDRTVYDATLDLTNGDIPAGVNEFQLKHPALAYNSIAPFPGHILVVDPEDTTGHIVHVLKSIDPAVFNIHVASKDLVTADGDFYIDMMGRVFTYTKTGDYSGQTATTYKTQLLSDTYDQAAMNVIPDINEGTSLCIVADSGTYYTVTLPEIRYLPKVQEDGTAHKVGHYPDDGSQERCAPVAFQAKLPYTLWNLQTDDIIPDGFVYLWDTKAEGKDILGGALVEGATYKKGDNDYTIRVSGVTLTVSDDRYRLITAGTTITELLNELRFRLDTHKHNNESLSLGGWTIDHDDLSGTHISPTEVSSDYGLTVRSPPSQIAGNDHPQYLSRYGWKSSVDANQYDNAMLGDLFMAQNVTDFVGYSYKAVPTNPNSNSKKIYFATTSTYMYKNTNDYLLLNSMDLRVNSNVADAKLQLGNTKATLGYNDTDSSFYLQQDDSGTLKVSKSALQAGTLFVHDETDPINSVSPGTTNYLKHTCAGATISSDYHDSNGNYGIIALNPTIFEIYSSLPIKILCSSSQSGATGLTLQTSSGDPLEIISGEDLQLKTATGKKVSFYDGTTEHLSIYYDSALSTSFIEPASGKDLRVSGADDITLMTSGGNILVKTGNASKLIQFDVDGSLPLEIGTDRLKSIFLPTSNAGDYAHSGKVYVDVTNSLLKVYISTGWKQVSLV